MSDILALFLADLNRSLDGLQQSLSRGAVGQSQAALHARDLSDALYGVNLPRHAELASSVSRHLASGRMGMANAAKELLRVTRGSLESLSAGQPQGNPEEEAALAALAADVALFDVADMNFNSAGFRAVLDASRRAEAPIESAAEATVEPESPSSLQAFVAPAISSADQEGQKLLTRTALVATLAQLQSIDHEIAQLAHYEVARQARFQLSDHANWLVSLTQLGDTQTQSDGGQLPVKMDLEILSAVKTLIAELGPGAPVEATQQQMTIFMLLPGYVPNAEQQRLVRSCMRRLCGRFELLPEGLRLVFPSSMNRLRVVPFRRNGQLYAISWSQLIGGETLKSGSPEAADLLGSSEGARLQLTVKIADQIQKIYADEVCPFQLANAFTLPSTVSSPPWIAGLLVGFEPEVMIWLAPSDF